MINPFSTEGQLHRAQKRLNNLEYNSASSLKIKNTQDKIAILQGRLDNKRAIKVAKAGATKIDKSKKSTKTTIRDNGSNNNAKAEFNLFRKPKKK